MAIIRQLSRRLPLLNVSRNYNYSTSHFAKSSLVGLSAISRTGQRLDTMPHSRMAKPFEHRARISTAEELTRRGSATCAKCEGGTVHADGSIDSQLSYTASDTTSKPEAVIQTPQNTKPDHPMRIHAARLQGLKRIICYFPGKIQRAYRKPRASDTRRRIGPTAIFICAKENPKSFLGGTFAVSVASLVLYWIVPVINNTAAVVNATAHCVKWWKDSRIGRWLRKKKQEETYWGRLKSRGKDVKEKYWVKTKAKALADAKPSKG